MTADAHTLKHAWEEWIETFELVLESKRVATQREKFVLLMTRGGKDIRDIHKNQAVCEEEVTELVPPRLVIPVYDNAIARLEKYFGSKITTRMELERFRSLKQGNDEDFSRFLLKLRAQAKRCNFGTRTEEEILYQAMRGAIDVKVRDKRIESDISLDKLTQYAIGREILKEQDRVEKPAWSEKNEMPVMSVGGGKLRPAKRDSFKRNGGRQSQGHKEECTNCGNWNHKAGHPTCRANRMKCFKCGREGHLALKCRSGRSQGKPRREINNVNDDWMDETPKIDVVKVNDE